MLDIRRFRQAARQPPLLLLQAALRRIPGRPLQIAQFDLYSLQQPTFPRVRGSGKISDGTLENVPDMAILEPKPQEVFHQRFKSGDQCLVALVDGRVVGYAWFTLDRTHREQRFDYLIEPPDDHVYAYDAYIHPDFRLRGTWVMLQQELWNECLRLGKAGICVLIDLENEASRKSHVRLNYRSVRRVTVVRVGSTRWFIERALRVC